jgi:hypothetical protein
MLKAKQRAQLAAMQHETGQIALLETALGHSKVANTLTIGHPTGASSGRPAALQKDDLP